MKIRLFILLFLTSSISLSQFINLPNFDEKDLRFGYFIGTNQYDYKIVYKDNPEYPISVERGNGLNVGLIGELKLNKNLRLSFEPGLYSNSKKLIFNERRNFTNYNDTLWTIKSNNIHFPLLLKYSSKRLKNLKPFLKGGISASINLSELESTLENYSIDNFEFAKFNIYYELSFGIDFYLRYFKFSPSIRGIFGLNNELPDGVPDNPWTGNIKKLMSRAIFINLSFY